MKPEIPFYESHDEYHCGEAALRSVLKFFFPQKEFSYEELYKLTEHNNGSWLPIIAKALSDFGLNVKYYIASTLGRTLQEELERLKNGEFNEKEERISANFITPYLKYCTRFLAEKDAIIYKTLSMADIENLLDKGFALIARINYYEIYPEEEKEPPFGHLVVLTGYDSENVFFHENNPNHAEANKKIKKELFLKSFRDDVDFFNDMIAVSAKPAV